MAELKALAEIAKIAGIAGLALGVVLIAFRDILRAKILARLSASHSFEILRLAMVLSFAIAVIGLAAWLYARHEALELARCAPVVTYVANDRMFDVRNACQSNEQTAQKQVVASAEAIREPVTAMLSVQAGFFLRAMEAYLSNPTPGNWKRIVKHVEFVDGGLNSSMSALTSYEAKSGSTAGSDALRRLLVKRIAFLAQFSADHPMDVEKAGLMLSQYRELTQDTYCALSSFIRDNGGSTPREAPPGLFNTCG